MRIGEVTKLTGLSEHTLRFYEKSGLLPPIAKKRGGVRDFGPRDIEALEIIECLKKTGMSLAEIRQFMEWVAAGDDTIQQRYDMFIERRRIATEQIDMLNKTLKIIDYKIKYYGDALRAGTLKIYDNKNMKMPDFFDTKK